MSPLLQAGLNVTGIGMGVVFVLLAVLVGIIRAMSALCFRLAGEPPEPSAGNTPPTGQAADAELTGVISAAIAAHRKRRRHQG